MNGLFGTTPAPWLTSGTLVYALDDRETANRFTARIEGGYEINYKRDPVRTSEAEIAATVRAIAQVPAMLELIDAMRSGPFAPVNWVERARAIASELEVK